MARPRQYDPETALDAAQAAFWSKGYSATSMSDLCAATGMKKGSLYQAFGDKHALFMTVLDRYLTRGADGLAVLTEADGAEVPDVLEAWLGQAGASACSAAGPGGCMAVNMRVELAPHDPAVRDRLAEHFDVLRHILADVLRRGQAAGSVRTDRSAEDMARLLELVLTGLVTAGRAGDGATAVAALAIDGIRAPVSAAR